MKSRPPGSPPMSAEQAERVIELLRALTERLDEILKG